MKRRYSTLFRPLCMSPWTECNEIYLIQSMGNPQSGNSVEWTENQKKILHTMPVLQLQRRTTQLGSAHLIHDKVASERCRPLSFFRSFFCGKDTSGLPARTTGLSRGL